MMTFTKLDMDKIINNRFNEFRRQIGLPNENMSARALEQFRLALEEYSQICLMEFCDHLNTYSGRENIRYDFMLNDFNDKRKVDKWQV